MVPAIVSQLVTLLKDTSLGFVVTYEEFLRRGEIAGEFGKNLMQTYLVIAAVYMVINLALSRTARRQAGWTAQPATGDEPAQAASVAPPVNASQSEA